MTIEELQRRARLAAADAWQALERAELHCSARFYRLAWEAVSSTGCVTLMAAELARRSEAACRLEACGDPVVHELQIQRRDLETQVDQLTADRDALRIHLENANVGGEGLRADNVRLRAELAESDRQRSVACKAHLAAVQELNALREAATELIEHREEASQGVWYISAKRGHKLLEVLGIAYVEKQ